MACIEQQRLSVLRSKEVIRNEEKGKEGVILLKILLVCSVLGFRMTINNLLPRSAVSPPHEAPGYAV